MEDNKYDKDPAVNSQLKEQFFIQNWLSFFSIYTALRKKLDHIIQHAFKNLKTYESYFDRCDNFQLTSNFVTLKEREVKCSDKVVLKKKLISNSHLLLTRV